MTNPHLHLARPKDLDHERDLKDATVILTLIGGIEQSTRHLVATGKFTRAEAEQAVKVFRTRGIVETQWENPRKRHSDPTLRMNKVHDHGGLWTEAAINLSHQDRSLWNGQLRFEHVVPAKVISTGIHDIVISDHAEEEKLALLLRLLRTLPHHVTLTRAEDLTLPPNMTAENSDNLLRTILGELHPRGMALTSTEYQEAVWSRYPQTIIDALAPYQKP